MKLFYFLLILLSISSCSFDKKTGIWKDENSSKIKDLFEKCKKGFKKPERRDSTVTSLCTVFLLL